MIGALIRQIMEKISGEDRMKYKVKPGDTLSAIAAHELGDASRATEIAQENELENPDLIQVGQELVLPGPGVQGKAEGGHTVAVASDESKAVVTLTAEQLAEMLPDANVEVIERYLSALNRCLVDYQIDTPLRVAHFIAQVGHESGSFRYTKENLNYSASALQSVFGKYFPSADLAEEYARQPEKIASRVYADRMGNGDESSGDGWKYCGRGLIQLTGKDNYQKYAESSGQDLVADPESVAENPVFAVGAAGWYWHARGLNQYADQDDVKEVTRRINGGYHGLDDRSERLERAKRVLDC